MQKQIIIMTMNSIRKNYEVGRLLEEAEKRGVKAKWVKYADVVMEINNQEPKIFVQGEEITGENTAGVWFRVAGTKTGKYPIGRGVLIRILRSKGVFCTNSVAYTTWERMGKIAQHGVFVEAGIPVVPTRVFYRKFQALEYKFNFPVIAKHDRGFQGRSVRKFESREELKKFIKKIQEKNLGMFVFQDYLPLKWDLRVIVIAGKVVGAMKRSAVGVEFRSNFSLGGDVEVWNLSEEDKQLAEKVAQTCGLDYCGVDIMKDESGRSYVLEVNRQCQYQGFEKSTGINVAGKVLEMLIDH